MKYFIVAVLFLPFLAGAHTSDQRYVDGYIVDLSTAPVAPWPNEKVGMSFVFRDPATGLATTTVATARISIDVLMRPNNKLQEIVFDSSQFLVENGGFVTSYVFSEEGTYDLHLSFVDTAGKEHLTGFRKQVRGGNPPSAQEIEPIIFFVTVITTSILGFFAGRFSVTKKS